MTDEQLIALFEPKYFTIAGHTINAPGFRSAEQFDRALHRAMCEQCEVAPFPFGRPNDHSLVIVKNPEHGTEYSVSRHMCSCPAGEQYQPCKHRALAIFLADVMGEL